MPHPADHVPITHTSRSPYVRLRAVGLDELRWTGGFLGALHDRCREVMVPTMQALMEGTERTHFLENFRIAAGLAEGRYRGPKWNDGDFYKWFESAVALLAHGRDAALESLESSLDRMIEVITAAQRDDGYLHTNVLVARQNGLDARPFADPMHFEMYNMGHLMTTACLHKRVTGKDTLLRVAVRAADFLDRTFANPTPAVARHGICPSHLMGLVELYRLTREPRWLSLAARLLEMRNLVSEAGLGDDDNQDRVPFREHRVAHGHAVRATYLYAGMADLYAETGDATLLAPLQRVWDDLVRTKLAITGGCGPLFDGASPDGSEDQLHITRVHQAFGRPFQLPHTTAHNETCAAIGNLMWSWRMLQITGEPKYADLVEHTFFNSVLAGISLDGTRFFYTNPLRQAEPLPCQLRWPRRRQSFLSCFCCPPNVVRTIAEWSGYACLVAERSLHLVLYGDGTFETTIPGAGVVALTQRSDYPWDGLIEITMDRAPDVEIELSLRIPEWAEGASARVNGGDAAPCHPGTFHPVRRRFHAGDRIVLDLPMPTRLLEAHPLVEEARRQVAIARGPIVYCLESPDLPADVRVFDVLVPDDIELTPVDAGEELSGITALRGSAIVEPSGDWGGRLYRPRRRPWRRSIETRFIPYFAWDNRGQSEMTVWLPLVS
jgi:DUF1680 family protein